MGIFSFRKYSRVEVDIPIHFFSESVVQDGDAYLSNLSEEGASLLCTSELPVAASLEFDISLPKPSLPAHVRADVLWSRPIQDNGRNMFAHGLQFDRIGVEDRERLNTFVENAMGY